MAVSDVPDGSQLFDCYAPLTPASLLRLTAAVYQGRGFRGCGRYLETLSRDEIALIKSHNLGLFTVGVAHSDSMHAPSADLGKRDGERHAGLLLALGVERGVTHVLDVEGTTSASTNDVITYINAWATAMRGSDPSASLCLYEGWGIPLSSDQLYGALIPSLYWASSPHSLAPAKRGFAICQVIENITIAGIQVDVDVANADHLGGRIRWQI
jgi:hypothetical protein